MLLPSFIRSLNLTPFHVFKHLSVLCRNNSAVGGFDLSLANVLTPALLHSRKITMITPELPQYKRKKRSARSSEDSAGEQSSLMNVALNDLLDAYVEDGSVKKFIGRRVCFLYLSFFSLT